MRKSSELTFYREKVERRNNATHFFGIHHALHEKCSDVRAVRLAVDEAFSRTRCEESPPTVSPACYETFCFTHPQIACDLHESKACLGNGSSVVDLSSSDDEEELSNFREQEARTGVCTNEGRCVLRSGARRVSASAAGARAPCFSLNASHLAFVILGGCGYPLLYFFLTPLSSSQDTVVPSVNVFFFSRKQSDGPIFGDNTTCHTIEVNWERSPKTNFGLSSSLQFIIFDNTTRPSLSDRWMWCQSASIELWRCDVVGHVFGVFFFFGRLQ